MNCSNIDIQYDNIFIGQRLVNILINYMFFKKKFIISVTFKKKRVSGGTVGY